MGSLIELFFRPPAMPRIPIPLPARIVPGIMSLIGSAFKLAYFCGVRDGFVAGILLTLLLWSLKGDSRGRNVN